MTATHVPVLAGELIELLDPQPGEVAVDCTFGGGGHARLVAGRLGPEGLLIAVDRDPAAEERYAELADEAPCRLRFIRAAKSVVLARALIDKGDAPLLRRFQRLRALESINPLRGVGAVPARGEPPPSDGPAVDDARGRAIPRRLPTFPGSR